MQTITEGIYYQDAYPGVILGAIITPKGTLLIDSPLRAEDARSWKSILLTHSRGPYRLLVNLDEQTDRTIGNRFMELTILTHQKAAESFESRSLIFKGQNNETGAEWENFPEVVGSRWATPSITFSDQLRLLWGDDPIELIHKPGPTPGSIWVEIPAKKIVFIGDAAMSDQPPLLERADLPGWIETLSTLRTPKYRNYTIISSRSGPITIEDVRNFHEFLKSVLRRLTTLANRNANPEDTAKMIPALLSKLTYKPQFEEFYSRRLRYGLAEYYKRHYGRVTPIAEG